MKATFEITHESTDTGEWQVSAGDVELGYVRRQGPRNWSYQRWVHGEGQEVIDGIDTRREAIEELVDACGGELGGDE